MPSDLPPDRYEEELKRELEGLLRNVSFEGSYPDTVVTAWYDDLTGRRVQTMTWTIWKGDDEYLTYDDPERAATDMWVQFMGS